MTAAAFVVTAYRTEQNRPMSVCPSVVALQRRLNRSLGLYAIRYCSLYDQLSRKHVRR
jgi:hypothetical protein